MRKATVVLLAAMALGACSKDSTAPTDLTGLFDEAATLGFSSAFAGDPAGNFLPPVNRLPENLKLTDAQGAQIKALLTAFEQSTKADRDALNAIMKQVKDAMMAKKSRAEIQALYDQAKPIRERLEAAEKKLHDDIWAVLTADQKAWLEANKPVNCASLLTDAQRNQISVLVAAFEQANKADLDAIQAALAQARTAQKSGATKDQIKAILDSVKPAMERVRLATVALQAAVAAVLTPDQLAAHCGWPMKLSGGSPPPSGGHK